MAGKFDRLVYNGWLLLDETTSSLSAVVQDLSGTPSQKVLHRDQAWQVKFDFTIGGALAVLPVGYYEIEVDAEYLGREVMCGKLIIPAGAGVWNPATPTPTRDYKAQIVPVAANVIPQEGVYRITKHLRYALATPALKTAAFIESEDIEFY